MFGKPPVTALQEYCAKKGVILPKYETIDAIDGTKSFQCSVEALGQTSYGNGRSKQEAKHDAAANLIKEVTFTHPDIMLIPQAPHEAIPTTDAVITLRDICVQQDHPLPTFEIIQQAGPAEAPEFTALCTLATIKRYGIANTKKAARQKAALEILHIIQMVPANDNNSVQLATLNGKIEESEEERYKKMRTYRELTDSGADKPPGVLLCDRHWFFEKFYDELKAEAKRILNQADYISDKERVGDVFKALKIVPKVRQLASLQLSRSIFIDLNLEYDVVFAGDERTIYGEIIQYFKDML